VVALVAVCIPLGREGEVGYDMLGIRYLTLLIIENKKVK
jgi:hypothetical protein